MTQPGLLLLAFYCFFSCHFVTAQECDSLPHGYYTLLQTPVKAGDSAVIMIRNIGKDVLYYDKHNTDGCYFLCFTGNRYDSTLSGGHCLTTDKYTLSGVFKPGETVSIRAAFPKEGYYMFVFSTNTYQRPFRRKGRKHWGCITLGFNVK